MVCDRGSTKICGSLTLAAKKSLLIDRSRTPTRMNLVEKDGGFSWFAPPTRFTVSSGASMLVEAGAELRLRNKSELHVMPGATLVLDNAAKLTVDAGCAVITHGDGAVKAKKRVLKRLKKKGRLKNL